MATKKLQDLAASTSPNDTDILLIEDTSATKKITFLSLFNKVKNKLGLGSLATKNKVAQSDMETAVGDLLNSIGKATDLTTTQKTNLVVAINELVESTNSLNRNKLVTENITLKIEQGQDWSYIPAKVGYHLISVMPTQFTGTYEIISGVSWQDSQYAVFLRAAPQTQHSFPAMAIWLPL